MELHNFFNGGIVFNIPTFQRNKTQNFFGRTCIYGGITLINFVKTVDTVSDDILWSSRKRLWFYGHHSQSKKVPKWVWLKKGQWKDNGVSNWTLMRYLIAQ